MKKLIIKTKFCPDGFIETLEDQKAEVFVSEAIQYNSWGLPERPELDEMGQPTGVILPAEYTVEIEDITAQVAQDAINAEALAYLASTDWLVIREMDSGVACPDDVKIARAEARQRIVRSS
jgi:hypothetical protein